jgi:hypothetical protein
MDCCIHQDFNAALHQFVYFGNSLYSHFVYFGNSLYSHYDMDGLMNLICGDDFFWGVHLSVYNINAKEWFKNIFKIKKLEINLESKASALGVPSPKLKLWTPKKRLKLKLWTPKKRLKLKLWTPKKRLKLKLWTPKK